VVSGRRAVIFDLDGTLVDTAVSIASALNLIRSRRGGLQPVPVNAVKQWISLGIHALVPCTLAETRGDPEGDIAEFRAEYANIRTDPERLYNGIRDTLDVLANAGFMLAVCSNKPQRLCAKVLEETGILGYFQVVIGGDAVANPKPHPMHLLQTLSSLGVAASEAVYVGDSSIDFLVARDAGVPFLLANYGYADPPLLEIDRRLMQSFDSPKELLSLLAPGMGAPREE
jgi:phosphoglycolate phosphatase